MVDSRPDARPLSARVALLTQQRPISISGSKYPRGSKDVCVNHDRPSHLGGCGSQLNSHSEIIFSCPHFRIGPLNPCDLVPRAAKPFGNYLVT
jgi:hypothetical protein